MLATKEEDYSRDSWWWSKYRAGYYHDVLNIEKLGNNGCPLILQVMDTFRSTLSKYFTAKNLTNLTKIRIYCATDIFATNDARRKVLFTVVEIQNGKYYDTGNKLEYLKTVVDFALNTSLRTFNQRAPSVLGRP